MARTPSASYPSTPLIRKPSVLPLPRRRPRILPPLSKRVLAVLRAAVAFLVIYWEYLTFSFAARKCSFDDSPSRGKVYVGEEKDKEKQRKWEKDSRWLGKRPFHVLVVADPQILDMNSYTDEGRSWILRKLGVWITDAYMRRAWRFVIRSRGDGRTWLGGGDSYSGGGKVDGVIWLGDLTDGARDADEGPEYAALTHRFHLLFPLPRISSSTSNLSSSKFSHRHLTPPIPSILLPGNHDVGLHLSGTMRSEDGEIERAKYKSSLARSLFKSSFGPLSGEKEWGGWRMIWIDSMGLLEERAILNEGGPAALVKVGGGEHVSFVQDLPDHAPTPAPPTILLTHIPLFRPESSTCSAGREHKGGIRDGKGRGYQNLMDQETSNWLLEKVFGGGRAAPVGEGVDGEEGPGGLVYSGDDHDLCITSHAAPETSSSNTIEETTVKSLSMAMGVRRPGYHLLSLYPPFETGVTKPSLSSTYTQKNCTLPDQIGIWLDVYLPALCLLVLGITAKNCYAVWQTRTARKASAARANGLPVHKHSHRRSLSRKLLFQSAAEDEEDDNDDYYSQFPTFPFSPGSPNEDMYSYHPGVAADEMPTSAAGNNGDRVRRVSRVWQWENGQSPFAHLGSKDVLSNRYRGGGGGEDDTPAFLRPFVRYFLRPFNRIFRTVFRKIWANPIGDLLKWFWKNLGGPMVEETVREVYSVVWVGVAAWFAIQVWFWL